MRQTIEFELDDRMVELAWRSVRAKHMDGPVRHSLRALTGFLASGALLALVGGAWVYVGVTIIALGVAFGLWVSLLVRRSARKMKGSAQESLERLSSRRIRYEFSDEGVQSQTELGVSRMSWKAFRELRRTPDVWLLFMTERRCATLPAKLIPPATQQFIVQRCLDHGIPVT